MSSHLHRRAAQCDENRDFPIDVIPLEIACIRRTRRALHDFPSVSGNDVSRRITINFKRARRVTPDRPTYNLRYDGDGSDGAREIDAAPTGKSKFLTFLMRSASQRLVLL